MIAGRKRLDIDTQAPPRRGRGIFRSIKEIIAQAVRAWFEHDAYTMGAALAFYTVFSVAPILIIASG